MLEDDSGRIRLVGNVLKDYFLVTGCIIAVMGTENVNGEFEVIDLKFADLPPQPEHWALSKPSSNGTTKKPKVKDEDVEMTDPSQPQPSKKIAIVSGLEFSGTDTSYAMELNLLLEFLLGEALDPAAQAELSHISRLIIAGNSIAKPSDAESAFTTTTTTADKKPHKKYGYDSSSYNPLPAQLLDTFLSTLLPTIPVTLLPGELDPANASYPQQPIHSAMFPKARTYASAPGSSTEPGWLDPVTNPWEGEVEGWRVLGTGGQNLDDICKYVDSEDRLGMMEAMCRWRCSAPTAPDTLCKLTSLSLPNSMQYEMVELTKTTGSYPFQEDEPFVMKECPHLYFVGCQPEFGTKIIEGPQGQMVRLILVPSFAATKEIVLVDTETLDVSKVKIIA
jgi:DNA polymerase delta subunit 2